MMSCLLSFLRDGQMYFEDIGEKAVERIRGGNQCVFFSLKKLKIGCYALRNEVTKFYFMYAK